MTTRAPAHSYDKPLPTIHPESRPFWDALKHHELHMQRCIDCRTVRYPASPVCYRCFSSQSQWTKLSGRGRVSAWVTVVEATGHPAWAREVPYIVALVELEEGPRLTSMLVGAGEGSIHNGMPVEAVFEDATPEVTLLKFRPQAS